jgi:hypothetical protein
MSGSLVSNRLALLFHSQLTHAQLTHTQAGVIMPARPASGVSAQKILFGHGDHGDHFHPHDPFSEYGKANPFFKPLVSGFLTAKTTPEALTQFADQWLLNPEIDGLNNLKSLHLFTRQKTLTKSLRQVSFFKRPGAFKDTALKTAEKICSVWPLKTWGKAIHKARHANEDAIVAKMLPDVVKNKILPLLHYNILANPKADAHLRAEAAKILVWDLIGQYQPEKDHYKVDVHPEFGDFRLPQDQYDAKRWGRKLWDALIHAVTYETQVTKEPKALQELAKVLSNFEYAWPHDAYQQAQAAKKQEALKQAEAQKPVAAPHTHDHDHDHDHSHGHAHSHKHGHRQAHSHTHAPASATKNPEPLKKPEPEAITIHRDADWDAPKRLAPELVEKLMVLPTTQPVRPLITQWQTEGYPADWSQQLFAKMLQAKQ